MKNLFLWFRSHPIKTILILIFAYPVLWVVFVFVGRVIYSAKKEIARPKVEAIHARKLDMNTILGKNIPPEPNEVENNTTVLGIDSNQNGIRDDVEIYLHKKYATSTRIKAKQLQYAMAIQAILGDPKSSDEMIALAQEEGRAYVCHTEFLPKLKLADKNPYSYLNAEVEKLVLNTTERREKYHNNFELINDSYSDDFGKTSNCDFNPNELPN